MADKTQAFVVVDLQKGVLADDGTWDPDGVVSRVAGLVDRARAAEVPVVWVQHNSDELVAGEEAWQLADGLVPADGEPVVQKRYGDSFEETELGEVLTSLGADHLVIAGAQTDACIRSTLHGAVFRGYDVTLVSDCHTTGEYPPEWTGGELLSARTKINFTNMYAESGLETASASGTVATSADVEF
jgi:nicotinamidase-related amidase